MLRKIMLGVAAVAMLVSLGGCFPWWYGPHGGHHHRDGGYDRGGRHHFDGGYNRGGSHHWDGGYDGNRDYYRDQIHRRRG